MDKDIEAYIEKLARGWETAAASYKVLMSQMTGQLDYIRQMEESGKAKRAKGALKPAAGMFHITHRNALKQILAHNEAKEAKAAKKGKGRQPKGQKGLLIGPHVLEDVPAPGSDSKEDNKGFGCGSVEILDLEDVYGSYTDTETGVDIRPALLFPPLA